VPEKSDQEKFEQEYREWICSISRDAALRLTEKSTAERERITESYRMLQDPRSVFRQLSDPRRIERLAGEEF